MELPADLSADQLKALSRTRIGGELIHLELDNGRKPAGDRGAYQGATSGGGRGGDRGGYSGGEAATSRATAASSANSARATASGLPLTVADAPSATAPSAALGSDAARKPRTEGGFKPRNKW